MTKADLKKSIDNTKKDMLAAAKDMDFLLAAKLRDEMFALRKNDGREVWIKLPLVILSDSEESAGWQMQSLQILRYRSE
jgi:excinuclease UvrABC nuclease subunit